jgi:simple sugar transport system permease protein
VVGESENTARYSGINVSRVVIRTMALSGAIAGVCGFLLAGDVGHTISTGLAGGRGFTAITVAWLGKLNPFAMIIVALFLVFMERGSIQIATDFNLSESASEILTGIILFFILGCEFFINYRLEFRTRKHQQEEVVKA